MTDDDLDRMIREADPYRPAVARHLDGADHDLLKEIITVSSSIPEPRARWRRVITSLAGASVAAAVVTGAIALSTTSTDRPDGTGSTSGSGTLVYSELALKAAEDNPRLLIGEPGWKATSVYGFADETGTIAFRNGGRELEMNWYPAAQYDGYREDRLSVSKPEPVTVDDRPAELFRYSATDFAVQLRPRDGSFVELRTGGTWSRPEFDRVLGLVTRADVRTWLAALPPEIVTPGQIGERAAAVLAGVPLPPGFDVAELHDLGTNDAYQFGAQVTGRVGCGWIAEWKRAKAAGDTAALTRASDAMRGSHDWKVLSDMNEEGDWPKVFWEVADEIAAGTEPVGYQDALDCPK